MLEHIITELMQMNISAGAKKQALFSSLTGNAERVNGNGAGFADDGEGKDFLPLLEQGMAVLRGNQKTSGEGITVHPDNDSRLKSHMGEKGSQQQAETIEDSPALQEGLVVVSNAVYTVDQNSDTFNIEALQQAGLRMNDTPGHVMALAEHRADRSDTSIKAIGTGIQGLVVARFDQGAEKDWMLPSAMDQSGDEAMIRTAAMTESLADVLSQRGLDTNVIGEITEALQDRVGSDKTAGMADLGRDVERPVSENSVSLTESLSTLLREKGLDEKVVDEVTAALQECIGDGKVAVDAGFTRDAERPVAESWVSLTESLSAVLREEGLDEKVVDELTAALQDRIGDGKVAVDAGFTRDAERPVAESRISLAEPLSTVLRERGFDEKAINEIMTVLQDRIGDGKVAVDAGFTRDAERPVAESRVSLTESLSTVLREKGLDEKAINEITTVLQDRIGDSKVAVNAGFAQDVERPVAESRVSLTESLATALREKGLDTKAIDEIAAALRSSSDAGIIRDVADPVNHEEIIAGQGKVSERTETFASQRPAVDRKVSTETVTLLSVKEGELKAVVTDTKAAESAAVIHSGEIIEPDRSMVGRIDRRNDAPSQVATKTATVESLIAVLDERGFNGKAIGEILTALKNRNGADQAAGIAFSQVEPDPTVRQRVIAGQSDPLSTDIAMPGLKSAKETAQNLLPKAGAAKFTLPDAITADALTGEDFKFYGTVNSTAVETEEIGNVPVFSVKGKAVPRESIPTGRMDVSISESTLVSAQTSDAKPIDGNLLVSQIADQLSQETHRGTGRIRITLSPENLGSLDMDVMVRENKVQVVLTAERSDVRQALLGQVDQLRSSLQELGLQVNGIDFQVRGNLQGMNGEAGGGPFWGQENRNGGMKRERGEERISLPQAIMSLTGRRNSEPVTAGISLYV